MSRSHKYHPFGGCKKWKFGKNQANRRIRRLFKYKGLTFENCFYKKVYPQWDICDYFCYGSLRDMLDSYYADLAKYGESYLYDSLEDVYRCYKKWYVRK